MIFDVLFPSRLHKDKNRLLTDIMVQVLLKQGQVEVSTTDLTADYTDSVLHHRSVVEDLNRTIRVSLYHQTLPKKDIYYSAVAICNNTQGVHNCIYTFKWWSDTLVMKMCLSNDFFYLYDQTLGEQKIASMVECKDFRKGIIQLQWEHRMMGMQIKDLNNKARDIQMLRLSEEQQDVSVIIILLFESFSHGPGYLLFAIKYRPDLNKEISTK